MILVKPNFEILVIMQEIMRPLLDECKKLIPIIFDDINY